MLEGISLPLSNGVKEKYVFHKNHWQKCGDMVEEDQFVIFHNNPSKKLLGPDKGNGKIQNTAS